MALNIAFDGWLNEVKTLDWGTVLVVTHDQRAKNAAGQWETVSKDWIDVTVDPSQIVNVEQGTLIHVEGTLKVSTYEKRDGSAGIKLRVRAKDIQAVQRGQYHSTQTVSVPSQNPAPAVDDELPF